MHYSSVHDVRPITSLSVKMSASTTCGRCFNIHYIYTVWLKQMAGDFVLQYVYWAVCGSCDVRVGFMISEVLNKACIWYIIAISQRLLDSLLVSSVFGRLPANLHFFYQKCFYTWPAIKIKYFSIYVGTIQASKGGGIALYISNA
jgi:hypothetical protein